MSSCMQCFRFAVQCVLCMLCVFVVVMEYEVNVFVRVVCVAYGVCVDCVCSGVPGVHGLRVLCA